LKKVDEALESGDKGVAQQALKVVQPELMRGVSKGIMHKNTASRKMSRLSSRVKALVD
jgi:small subunit ribosomal protein S20